MVPFEPEDDTNATRQPEVPEADRGPLRGRQKVFWGTLVSILLTTGFAWLVTLTRAWSPFEVHQADLATVGATVGPATEGHVTPAMLLAAVEARRAEFRRCYRDAFPLAATRPALEARVRMDVAPSGQVSNARVTRASTPNRTLSDCLAREANAMRLPASTTEKHANILYPFVFHPNDGELP